MIIPFVFIVFGLFTRIGLPKKVNWWIGYRTSMACKNQNTWVFAHKHAGKLWIILGFVLLILSVVAWIFTDSEAFEMWPVMVMIVQVVLVVLALIPTEIALRKKFDKNGERRNR
jgi:uncharacterized membrane protein